MQKIYIEQLSHYYTKSCPVTLVRYVIDVCFNHCGRNVPVKLMHACKHAKSGVLAPHF